MKQVFFIFLLLVTIGCSSSKVITSNVKNVSIYSNKKLVTDKWKLSKDHSPDIYFENIRNDKKRSLIFKTDVEKILLNVEDKSIHNFTIRYKGRDYHQRVIGEKLREKASFTSDYKKGKKGRIDVSIKPAYELLNIAIALSDYGQNKKGIVQKETQYYRDVMKRFGQFQKHPFVLEVDTLCKSDLWMYFNLKMNGHSVKYINKKIVRSEIFGSTSFQNSNILVPYLNLMQDFSDKSNFLDFFNKNQVYYNKLESFYSDTIGLQGMLNWLDKNFPGNGKYDYTHIIFSPLVASNQSLVSFNNNGFKELQPHVNFPHENLYGNIRKRISKKALEVFRGTIVFTELNHGYSDSETLKFKDKVLKATSNKKVWSSKKMQKLYPGFRLFNEYMNWAQVTLRAIDILSERDAKEIERQVNTTMTKNREFYKFEKLMNYLIPLYKNRKSRTLSDLYPEIIKWFVRNNDI